MSYYPEWDSCSLWNGRGDTDIYRHDGMIREEIDQRIAQYKQELENL